MLRRWARAIGQLPPGRQAGVELELAQVNELSGRDGTAHLLEASRGRGPPADVPDGPPLALWFLVRRPSLFHEVFIHHEGREAGAWRAARAVRVPLDGLAGRADALRDELLEFFRRDAGRFCAVDARPFKGGYHFAAHVADRVRLLEGFTERGHLGVERVRPAMSVLFAYSPSERAVLLKSHLRSADRLRELFARFGRAVLGEPAEWAGEAYDLDRLKFPFRPAPDAPDMESVRVKFLSLRYPVRLGQRKLKLETLTSDSPSAIHDLVASHAGRLIDELRVCHAELQVRLRVAGSLKNYVIRLWPDRCSLNHTPLGWRLRRCLRRWGLAHDF